MTGAEVLTRGGAWVMVRKVRGIHYKRSRYRLRERFIRRVAAAGRSERPYHCPVLPPPHFILNPTAASGRAAKWWRLALPVLQQQFPGMSYTVTDDLHALEDRVVTAVTAGHRFLVGVGGDGTHHHLINLLVRQGLTELITYAPLPLGSGNDWCRTLGIPRHLLRWIEVIKCGRTIPHRIGKLTYGTGTQVQYFINVAGLAYDAEVVRRSLTLRNRRRWMYPFLTLVYLKDFNPPYLTLHYDNRVVRGHFHTINLGIGRYSGGGMQLVPQADPTADTLALTYAVDVPISRILTSGWRLYTGTVGRVAGITTTRAKRITIDGLTGVEADGEYLGEGKLMVELAGPRVRVVVGESGASGRNEEK